MNPSFLDQVKDDLDNIEDQLKQNLTPYLEVVSQIASHILFSGGKRLRPLLMVLSARLCGYKGQDDTKIATVFEYLHTASLLHDDLVDHAATRRGKPAAHSLWDNSVAVLTGDFLLARSLSIITATNSLPIIKHIASITENMSQGEIHQLITKGQVDLSEKEYLEMVHRKTAVLIQGACQIGASLAQAEPQWENALSQYGLNLGIAFQITDDLLDYTANPETLGKPTGADIRDGKITLPLIYTLNQASSQDHERLKIIISNPHISNQDWEILLELITKYNGISYTSAKAEEYIEKTRQSLAIFPASPVRKILLEIADYALKRKK